MREYTEAESEARQSFPSAGQKGKIVARSVRSALPPSSHQRPAEMACDMIHPDSLPALYRVLPAWLRWLWDPAVFVAISLGLALLGLVSLFVLPFLLARIPADYFVTSSAPARRGSAPWFGRVARNVLGGLMLLLGIAMLVLPGQGVLTIFAALFLLGFPGKRRLERWFVLMPRVLGVLNSLRARAGRPPLELDHPELSPPSRRDRD